MTPKEKALDLFEKYYKHSESNYTESATRNTAKQCALLCIDEILQTNPTIKGTSSDLVTMIVQTKAYWHQVQEEISKL